MPAEIYHIKELERIIKKQDERISLLEELLLKNFHILTGVDYYSVQLKVAKDGAKKPQEQY